MPLDRRKSGGSPVWLAGGNGFIGDMNLNAPAANATGKTIMIGHKGTETIKRFSDKIDLRALRVFVVKQATVLHAAGGRATLGRLCRFSACST
jgi:hypothetical protein